MMVTIAGIPGILHADGIITGFTSVPFGHWPCSQTASSVMRINPAWPRNLEHFTFSGYGGILWSQTAMRARQPSDYLAYSVNSFRPAGSVFALTPASDKVTLGLGFFSPAVMNGQWANDWIGKYIVQRFTFQTWAAQTLFSYRMSDHIQAAMSPLVYVSGMHFVRAIDLQNMSSDDGVMELNGRSVGFGGRAGFFADAGPIDVGLTGSIPVVMKVVGQAQFVVAPALADSFPQDNAYAMFTDLPSSIGVQLCYKRDDVPVMSAGLDYTFGSTYDSSLVDFADNTTLLPDPFIHSGRSQDLTVWLGMCERSIASNWKLSFGGFYSTGTAKEHFLSPLAPDAGKAGLHACLSTPISDALSFECAIGYMETAVITGELAAAHFEGTYKSRTWTFHIGISGK